MGKRTGMGSLGRISLVATLIGLLYHGWLIWAPPASGNGLTTLPMVLFLTLVLAPALLDASGIPSGKVRQALRRDRRYLGICTGLWAIAHGLTKSVFSLGAQPEGWLKHALRPEIAPALIGLLILTALLLTSNDRAQKRLGAGWRRLHGLVWTVPGIALVHGWAASATFTMEGFMNLPVLIPLLLICAGVVAGLVRTRKYRPFAYLLSGAAFSLLLLSALAPGADVSILME